MLSRKGKSTVHVRAGIVQPLQSVGADLPPFFFFLPVLVNA